MTLREKIELDLREALKSRDPIRVSTLRMLKSAVGYAVIEKKNLSESDIMDIVAKQVKQHQDSIASFEKGNRVDLAEKEKKELEILSSYLPKQLSQAEIEQEVTKAIQETKAATKAQTGQVMKLLMERLKGKADGKLLSQIVSSRLK